jgi:hypothetical protein
MNLRSSHVSEKYEFVGVQRTLLSLSVELFVSVLLSFSFPFILVVVLLSALYCGLQ